MKISCKNVGKYAWPQMVKYINECEELTDDEKRLIKDRMRKFLKATCGDYKGCKPRSIAGAVIWLSTKMRQIEAGQIVGVTEITIRHTARKIAEVLPEFKSKRNPGKVDKIIVVDGREIRGSYDQVQTYDKRRCDKCNYVMRHVKTTDQWICTNTRCEESPYYKQE